MEEVEEIQTTEHEVSIDAALTHVVKGMTAAKEGRKCVDGRYAADGAESGMIARPGGDYGYVMALLSVNRHKNLGLTPEQCVDAVYNALTADGNKFYMHTDTHAHPSHEHDTAGEHHDAPVIGCGHIAKALNSELATGYAIPEEDMQRAFDHMQTYIQQGKSVHMAVLEGSHWEQGVLVVDSETHAVNPHNEDEKENSMYFVYDKKRDDAYIEKELMPRLHIEGLTAEDFKTASDIQLKATLHNLALGAQMYHVEIDEDEVPVVVPMGKVE